MKQRITFIHEPGGGLDPSTLDIGQHGLKGPDLLAVREDRFTWGEDEIPEAFRALSQNSEALHVRWVSPVAYRTVSPLVSRLSPGLHIFYTPAKGRDANGDLVCSAKREAFGGDAKEYCQGNDHFTRRSTDSHPDSAELQYYELIEDIGPFVDFITRHCASSDAACRSRAGTLGTAASIDISWDATSAALKLTAQWPHGSHSLSVASTPGHRTEVGILGLDAEAQAEAHELGISGALTVLDSGKSPSPVMFAFPARHRQAEASFDAGFLSPTGLHPTLQLALSGSRPPVEDGGCALHAHLTLPKTVFADRYQLSDDLFLASKNLTALRRSTAPVDLEAPAYATRVWGSGVLLELAPPAGGTDGPWTAEIPLHMRYLAPNAEGYAEARVPYPAVFWACDAGAGVEFPSTPFERAGLGYDALFGGRTVFWHVEPQARAGAGAGAGDGGRLVSAVRVPVLDEGDAPWVRMGTAGAVVLGFAWVLWVLVRALLRTGHGRRAASKGKKTQ